MTFVYSKLNQMLEEFTALDFETATGQRSSICQVGLVLFKKGEPAQELNLLIKPPDNAYWYRFTEIHGISAETTASEKNFEEQWEKVRPFLESRHVVAHNGMAFDFPVLKETLKYYGLSPIDFVPHDTYKLYRKNLADLCKAHAIPLNHHDALSDALACGELFKRYLLSSQGLSYLKNYENATQAKVLPKPTKKYFLLKSR